MWVIHTRVRPKNAKPYLVLSGSFVRFLKCQDRGAVKLLTLLPTTEIHSATNSLILRKMLVRACPGWIGGEIVSIISGRAPSMPG